jgi:hypothetical protein
MDFAGFAGIFEGDCNSADRIGIAAPPFALFSTFCFLLLYSGAPESGRVDGPGSPGAVFS